MSLESLPVSQQCATKCHDVVLDPGQATHADQFTPTANGVLLAHCLSVEGLWVVVGEEMEREGVINREIKRDGGRDNTEADRWIILNSVL